MQDAIFVFPYNYYRNLLGKHMFGKKVVIRNQLLKSQDENFILSKLQGKSS